MKYLFVIQGEGRGHITQSLSLKRMLEKNGHEVCAMMVGSSAKRRLPDFFVENAGCEIIRFRSPNFLPTPKGKGSPLISSILYNIALLPVYAQSLIKIKKTIETEKPDVVINFYEIMCGFTYGVFKPSVPMVNIAHQYYFLTPDFEYKGKNRFRFKLLNFFSRLTAIGNSGILALSFRPAIDDNEGRIRVVPPLLRQEVLEQEVTTGRYIHGYLLNKGLAKEIEQWSEENLLQPLHFFWDKKEGKKVELLTPMLAMHQLNDKLFLHYMAGCKAFATTGGFESVCEAMYMQKPVLMVPTHIEQECNALDAMDAGAGVFADSFDMNILLKYAKEHKNNSHFRFWVHASERFFMAELTNFEKQQVNERLVPQMGFGF